MIIVRRVIHKKTTSFGLFTPEQLGQTFQCNFAKRDDISFRRDKNTDTLGIYVMVQDVETKLGVEGNRLNKDLRRLKK